MRPYEDAFERSRIAVTTGPAASPPGSAAGSDGSDGSDGRDVEESGATRWRHADSDAARALARLSAQAAVARGGRRAAKGDSEGRTATSAVAALASELGAPGEKQQPVKKKKKKTKKEKQQEQQQRRRRKNVLKRLAAKLLRL